MRIHAGDSAEDVARRAKKKSSGWFWEKWTWQGSDRPRDYAVDASARQRAYYDLKFLPMYKSWRADNPRLVRERVPHSLIFGGMPFVDFSNQHHFQYLVDRVPMMWPLRLKEPVRVLVDGEAVDTSRWRKTTMDALEHNKGLFGPTPDALRLANEQWLTATDFIQDGKDVRFVLDGEEVEVMLVDSAAPGKLKRVAQTLFHEDTGLFEFLQSRGHARPNEKK
jgi:hypothetical protein